MTAWTAHYKVKIYLYVVYLSTVCTVRLLVRFIGRAPIIISQVFLKLYSTMTGRLGGGYARKEGLEDLANQRNGWAELMTAQASHDSSRLRRGNQYFVK